MVVRYLIGIGDELPPLRYRLLPVEGFVNMQMFEDRRALGYAAVAPVAVHCGYLNTMGDKLEHMEKNGFLERGLASHRALAAAANGLARNSTPVRTTRLTLKKKDRTLTRIWV